MKKTINNLMTVFGIILLGLFFSSVIFAKETKMHGLLRITTFGTGASSYFMSIPIGESIKKQTGLDVRVIPSGTDMGRILPVREKEADLTFSMHSAAYYATHAWSEYSKPNWGPQPLRIVYRGLNFVMGPMTRANSGIKELTADKLRGKRFPYVPGNPSGNACNLALLRFANLTWDDVKKVTLSSWSTAMQSVLEGSCDVAYSSVWTASAIELQASPHGIYWIPMPVQNKQGWKQVQEEMPYASPILAKEGAGISAQNPVELLAYGESLFSYPWFPEEVAYTVAKAMWYGYDDYKDKHPNCKDWRHENASNWESLTVCPYPYHPGSIKFFKEIGVWSEKNEKWQKEQIMLEKERVHAWNAAKEDAKSKKIEVGGEGWEKFWRDYLQKWLQKIEAPYSYFK